MAQPSTVADPRPAAASHVERRSYISMGLICGLGMAIAILLTVWHNLPLDWRVLMGVALLVVASVGGALIGWFVAAVTASQEPTQGQE